MVPSPSGERLAAKFMAVRLFLTFYDVLPLACTRSLTKNIRFLLKVVVVVVVVYSLRPSSLSYLSGPSQLHQACQPGRVLRARHRKYMCFVLFVGTLNFRVSGGGTFIRRRRSREYYCLRICSCPPEHDGRTRVDTCMLTARANANAPARHDKSVLGYCFRREGPVTRQRPNAQRRSESAWYTIK